MTNPITVFTMQTTGAQDMTTVGRGTAIPEMTAALAAALTAGMKREHYLACRWAWMQDYVLVNELRGRMMSVGYKISKQQKWKDPNAVRLESLVDLALHEIAGIGRKTELKGVTINLGPIKGHPDRYRHLGWDKHKWFRWKDRYEEIFRIVRDWESDGRRYVNRQQRED